MEDDARASRPIHAKIALREKLPVLPTARKRDEGRAKANHVCGEQHRGAGEDRDLAAWLPIRVPRCGEHSEAGPQWRSLHGGQDNVYAARARAARAG